MILMFISEYSFNSSLIVINNQQHLFQYEDELGSQLKIEGKPAVLQKFSKQCQVCLRMFYNEAKYEEDQEEHSKLIDLSGSMHCPSCYVKVAKLEINQHYLDDHPELKSACCLHCEGKISNIGYQFAGICRKKQ